MPSISTSFLIALLRASGDGLVMRWVCNEQNETLLTITSKIYFFKYTFFYWIAALFPGDWFSFALLRETIG